MSIIHNFFFVCLQPIPFVVTCLKAQSQSSNVCFATFQCKDTHLELQHTATHCNTLQHTATHCNTLQQTHCNTLQHTATHCNTLQHTPKRYEPWATTHCNTLQHALQHTTSHTIETFEPWVSSHVIWVMCGEWVTNWNVWISHELMYEWVSSLELRGLKETTHCTKLQQTTTHCNTLQHTATHCTTL